MALQGDDTSQQPQTAAPLCHAQAASGMSQVSWTVFSDTTSFTACT